MNDLRTCARITKGLYQTISAVEDSHYLKKHPIIKIIKHLLA